MTKYGSEETVSKIDDLGSEISNLSKFRSGIRSLVGRRYFNQSIVRNTKEESDKYFEFSRHIEKLRGEGKLYLDQEDRTTWPCYYLKFPRNNIDGSYMIVKHWMEKHDLFGK